MPFQRKTAVCRICHQEAKIYRAGACRPCDTRLHADAGKPSGKKIEPVDPHARPMLAPVRCQVCGQRLAPPSGVCFRCVCVAAYQPPPVPYYPESAA